MEKTIQMYNIPVSIQIPDIYKQGIKKFRAQFNSLPDTNANPLVEIRVVDNDTSASTETLNNPSSHKLLKDGFTAKYPKYTICYYYKNSKLKIEVRLFKQGNKAIEYLKKLYNIQYENIEERLTQIIWENCLYPAVYFFPEYTLVHCSGFSYNNEEALLLGGTGGVGKTSLELELAKNENFGFLNDDIAILNKTGQVYPNLSWPKIYAYNLVHNKKIKDLIFANRSIDDKLAWKIKKGIFGSSKVRRTINPSELFSKATSLSPVPLKKYIFLSRGNYSKLKLKKFNTEKVAELNVSVLKTEFSDFEKHLNWHYFNSVLADKKPIIDLEVVHRNWLKLNHDIFKDVACYIMEIPISMPHNRFKSSASKMISKLFE
ncbi:hypothetical protein [Sunxiuqinia indica]|uniref:hypothetical protein n=1 Tax=Sunxiuqinia indica TaxID=2692584 RepID=UPI001356CF5F|nr:hypothetical protein [Sunxiuqinia indica]